MQIESVEDFVRFKKTERLKIRLVRTFILIVFLTAWEFLSRLGLIDSFLFASPTSVLKEGYELTKNGVLFANIGVTLIETLVTFFVSTTLGIVLGVLFWYFEKLKEILDPYLVLLNSIPKTAIAPLIIVWFGIGYPAIIVVGVSIGIFATTMSYISALLKVDTDKIKLIYVLGGNKKDVLTELILPYSIPNIIAISKVNIGLSLIGVIIGEFLVAEKGLGYMIIYGSQIFDLNMVILSLCILSLISFWFYFIITLVDKKYNI